MNLKVKLKQNYIIIIFLVSNRFIFNYVKRLYPFIEFNNAKSKLPKMRIAVPILLLGTLGSLFGWMIIEIIKLLMK